MAALATGGLGMGMGLVGGVKNPMGAMGAGNLAMLGNPALVPTAGGLQNPMAAAVFAAFSDEVKAVVEEMKK